MKGSLIRVEERKNHKFYRYKLTIAIVSVI